MLSFDFFRKADEILATFSSQKSVSLSEILQNSAIDTPYKTFIAKEIERETYELTEIIRNFSIFEFSDETLENKLNELIYFLNSNAKIALTQLKPILVRSIKLRFNFLFQPHSTLLFFVFDNSFKKEKQAILLSLDYFLDYPHLINELKQKVVDFDEEKISKYEFLKFLNQIEIEFFERVGLKELIELFEPIFKFFEAKDQDGIPTIGFVKFFEDIGLNSFAGFFEQYSQQTELVAFDSLKEIFGNILQQNKRYIDKESTNLKTSSEKQNVINFSNLDPIAFELPKDIPPPGPEYFELQAKGKESIVAKSSEIEEIKELLEQFDISDRTTKHEETPLDEQEMVKINTEEFEINKELKIDSLTKEELEIEPAITSTQEFLSSNIKDFESQEVKNDLLPNDRIENEETKENELKEPLEEISESQNEAIELEEPRELARKPKLLRELIGDAEKAKFIEELFYTMSEFYDELVNKIDTSSTLEEALEYVNNYFQEFGIFVDAPIAKEFIEYVKSKFN